MKRYLFLVAVSLLATVTYAASSLAGATVTLDGTTQQLSTLLSAANGLPASNTCVGAVFVQSAKANANPTYIGKSGVTGATDATAYVDPAGAISLDGGGTCINLNSIYVIGTNGEKLHVSIL